MFRIIILYIFSEIRFSIIGMLSKYKIIVVVEAVLCVLFFFDWFLSQHGLILHLIFFSLHFREFRFSDLLDNAAGQGLLILHDVQGIKVVKRSMQSDEEERSTNHPENGCAC